jgi:AraC family transcriptional regulator
MDGGAGLGTLADVYRSGVYAPYLRGVRGVGVPPVALVRFAQPAGTFPDPPTGDYTLAINEAGSGRMCFDVGAGRVETPFRPGDLVLKPPGVATHFANNAPHAKLFISLPLAVVSRITEGHAIPRDGALPDFGRLHAGSFRSRRIARLLALLWAEAIAANPQGPLLTQGVVASLTALLLRAAHPAAPAPRTAPSLSTARLRLLDDWVQANLSEPFSLEEMAGSVGLSVFHFSRALKASTGLTPRGLVTRRRLERAEVLLAEGRMPLAEIALATGFADQAHFTNLFRRETGVTPGAWRRLRAAGTTVSSPRR